MYSIYDLFCPILDAEMGIGIRMLHLFIHKPVVIGLCMRDTSIVSEKRFSSAYHKIWSLNSATA